METKTKLGKISEEARGAEETVRCCNRCGGDIGQFCPPCEKVQREFRECQSAIADEEMGRTVEPESKPSAGLPCPHGGEVWAPEHVTGGQWNPPASACLNEVRRLKKAEASGDAKLNRLRVDIVADFTKEPPPSENSFAATWYRYILGKIDGHLAEPPTEPEPAAEGDCEGCTYTINESKRLRRSLLLLERIATGAEEPTGNEVEEITPTIEAVVQLRNELGAAKAELERGGDAK